MQSYFDYKESLDESYLSILATLNELVKTYPIQKLSPNYKPYLDEYNENKENLEKSLSNLISVRNSIKKDLLLLNTDVSSTNNNLTKIDKENDYLLEEKENIDDDSGAHGELEQKKYIYNEKLVQNILLVLAICVFIGIYFKVSGQTLSTKDSLNSGDDVILPKESIKNLVNEKGNEKGNEKEYIQDILSKSPKLNRDRYDDFDGLFDTDINDI